MKKSSKSNPKKEMTLQGLADLVIKKIDELAVSTDKKISMLAFQQKADIEELGQMVARGFENTATKEDISSVRIAVRGEIKEVQTRLDKMKFNHEKRIENLEDRALIHQTIFEKQLNIKVPRK